MRIGIGSLERAQILPPLHTPASLPKTFLGCKGEPLPLWLVAGEDVRIIDDGVSLMLDATKGHKHDKR